MPRSRCSGVCGPRVKASRRSTACANRSAAVRCAKGSTSGGRALVCFTSGSCALRFFTPPPHSRLSTRPAHAIVTMSRVRGDADQRCSTRRRSGHSARTRCARAYALECSCLYSGGRRWPRRTRVESFEVLIKPFHEGHEPPPVGSMFFGAGRIVLEAFKLEAERGELL